MKDSFSMANMAPQLHSLNAGVWEKGENDVRAWALERGELVIYVGTMTADGDATIGDDKVDVPAAFWKVVVDPAKKQVIAWVMPQDARTSSGVAQWLKTISAIEHDAGIHLALPEGVDRNAAKMWTADFQTWKSRRDAACSAAAHN
jgi:endonuclease G, mitochondrial